MFVRDSVLVIEFDRYVEVGDRSVVVLFVGPDCASAAIRQNVVGIEPDRLTEIGECLVEFRFPAPRGSPVMVAFGGS